MIKLIRDRQPGWVVAVASVLLAIGAAGSAQAQGPKKHVTLPAAADTSVDSYYKTGDSGSFGTSPALCIGNGGPANCPVVERPLLRFDLTNIPPRSVVTKATLRMAFSGNNTLTKTTLTLYRMKVSWTEAGACWNTRDGSARWSKPGLAAGVDYAAKPSTSLTSAFRGKTDKRLDFEFPNLVADVQDWVNTPETNHGWVLINSDEVHGRGSSYPDKQFMTREWCPAAANGHYFDAQPYLDVDYITAAGR